MLSTLYGTESETVEMKSEWDHDENVTEENKTLNYF